MALAASIGAGSVFDRLRRIDPLIVSGLVLAIAPLWQLRFGVIPDTSWIITMCERVLAGDRLYVDLIETNPPFTLWLYMPAVALARWIGASPEIVVHIYCYAITLAGLAFAAAIVRRAGLAEKAGLFAILPVIVALLVIFPGNAFTEREHLGAALLLPILALMGWRAMPDAPKPGWVLPIAAGACASVIMMVKPYYALMILAPALWVAWRRRSLRALFAPEYWAAAIVCCAYLAAVIRLYPEYLATVFPLLRDTYMRASDPALPAMIFGPTIAFASLLIYRSLAGRSLTPLVTIALLAAAAGIVPLVYQGKGWAYHAYPAMLLLLTAFAYVSWQQFSAEPRPRMVSLLLVVTMFLVAAQPFVVTQRIDAGVISRIRASVQNPSVALIGAGIEAGHPMTRMIGGRWIGSYCSDWLGAMAFVFGDVARAEGNAETAKRYDAMLADFVSRRSAELRQARPDIVLLQQGDGWVDAFLQQPAMAGFMDDFTQIAEDGRVRVYRRK